MFVTGRRTRGLGRRTLGRLTVTSAVARMLAALVLAGAPALAAVAAPSAAPALHVIDVWSRATAPGATVGVVYFTVVNPGDADVLTRIESPSAERAEMHSTATVNGMMEMRPVESVDVPAGGRVVFEPGGLHVMLIDLKRPLVEGERVPLTLIFRGAGKMPLQATVRGLGAMTPTSAPAAPAAAYRLTAWPPHAGTPDFKLVDAAGQPHTLADFRGYVTVIFFGFVHCPDVCPAELFKLSLVMKQLGESADRIRVLFVTLDPARDTRDVLKRYVAAFDPRFIGLTGTAAQVDAAAGNFHVVYAHVGTGADYTIDHSSAVFVVDGKSRLRLIGTADTATQDYAHDLALLAAE